MNFYYEFWSKAFALSLAELRTPHFALSTAGTYVEKHHNKYLFLYTDLASGKKILAGTSAVIATLGQVDRANPPEELPGLTASFRDIDYGFPAASDFYPMPANSKVHIKPVTGRDRSAIEEFLKGCSEDDQDTLDLTFENEFALGLFDGGKILGVSRYAAIKDNSKLVDITVMMTPTARGLGLAAPLVSQLIEEIFKCGLYPKYRVSVDNAASLAVARKLGLRPMYKLITYAIPCFEQRR